MPRYVPEDILVVLNHVEWKRGLEILEDLERLKGVGNSFWAQCFHTPSIGWLYFHLERLEQQKLITSRWQTGTDEETLARRGGRRVREFQLTSDGFRRKDEILEARKEGGPIGQPAIRPIWTLAAPPVGG